MLSRMSVWRFGNFQTAARGVGSFVRLVVGRCGCLRLLDGALLCTRCCIRRGASPRTWSMSVRQRAERRIPRLKAMLETETSLRLKPVLRGKMERRSRMRRRCVRLSFVWLRVEL